MSVAEKMDELGNSSFIIDFIESNIGYCFILTQFVNVLLIVCGFIYKNFELLRTVELISRVTIENRDKMSLNI